MMVLKVFHLYADSGSYLSENAFFEVRVGK